MPSLDYLPDASTMPQCIELTRLPFILGRGGRAHFVIPNVSVSREHAELFEAAGQIWIRDLESRNGISVNGKAVQRVRLVDGDIIHVAHNEFRFRASSPQPAQEPASILLTELATGKIPPSVLYGKPLLKEMLQAGALRTIFQPILDLQTGQTVGFEALGRGSSPHLSTRPEELFRLASRCSLSSALSRAFRQTALHAAQALPRDARVFFNLHPEEFETLSPGQFDRLLPPTLSNQHFVVEVHEDAVTDIGLLRELCAYLRQRKIEIAYDDFGAGQSRLAELAEVPPDFIKIDMRLIRNIHAAGGRRDVVRAICDVARRLNVTVIAEGVETHDELEVCKDLGCHLGQGYLLGHPEHSERTALPGSLKTLR